jgi:hypothetical protein
VISQGTFEWYLSRFGMITMSERVDTVMFGNPHQLNNLLETIKWERLVKEDVEHVRREFERENGNAERVAGLKWGREKEFEGLLQYELTTHTEIKRVEFKTHDLWPDLVGDSTDWIEAMPGKGDDGTPMRLVVVGEMKCYLDEANHLKALRYGMDPKHYNQVQGHIECWGVKYGKFISYDPRAPVVDKQLYQQTIEQDPQWQLRFRTRMQQFATHLARGTRFDFEMQGARDGIPSLF